MFISNLHNMHAFMYIQLLHLNIISSVRLSFLSFFHLHTHTFQEESKTMLDEDD